MTQIGDGDDYRPRVSADYGYVSGDPNPQLISKDRRTGVDFRCSRLDEGSARETDRWLRAGASCSRTSFRGRNHRERSQRTRRLNSQRVVKDTLGNSRSHKDDEGCRKCTRWLCCRPSPKAWMVHRADQVHKTYTVSTDGLTPFSAFEGTHVWHSTRWVCERVWLRQPPLEKVSKRGCWGSASVDFFGRFRFVRTVKRISFEDRCKIVSPSDAFSAGDLELTLAEVTCSLGTREEVDSAAQRRERGPADATALGPDPAPIPRGLCFKQEDFLLRTLPCC